MPPVYLLSAREDPLLSSVSSRRTVSSPASLLRAVCIFYGLVFMGEFLGKIVSTAMVSHFLVAYWTCLQAIGEDESTESVYHLYLIRFFRGVSVYVWSLARPCLWYARDLFGVCLFSDCMIEFVSSVGERGCSVSPLYFSRRSCHGFIVLFFAASVSVQHVREVVYVSESCADRSCPRARAHAVVVQHYVSSCRRSVYWV